MADTTGRQLDPGREQLGAIYAKALLGATEKAGNTADSLEQLQSIAHDVLGTSPRLKALFSSPRIPPEAKLQMLDQAFGGRVTEQLLRFLKIVARRGRMAALPEIARAARRLHNELAGRVAVEVQTAHPLDATQRQQVQHRLTTQLGKEIDLATQVRPELLGGMIVRVGDTVFDTSLAERLRQMRARTRENAATRIRQSLDQFAHD